MGICPQAHMSACDVKVLADRVKGALFGLLIGDALSMPTHWFYGGERQVAATYGRITDYVAPTDHLRGSIMSKSNTGGAGRGGFHGDVIGSVVFHGKKEFWKPGADYHYHQGMAAGDNTLEALLARRVINVTGAASGQFDRITTSTMWMPQTALSPPFLSPLLHTKMLPLRCRWLLLWPSRGSRRNRNNLPHCSLTLCVASCAEPLSELPLLRLAKLLVWT